MKPQTPDETTTPASTEQPGWITPRGAMKLGSQESQSPRIERKVWKASTQNVQVDPDGVIGGAVRSEWMCWRCLRAPRNPGGKADLGKKGSEEHEDMRHMGGLYLWPFALKRLAPHHQLEHESYRVYA